MSRIFFEGAVSGNLQGRLGRKLAVNADGEIAVVTSHFQLKEGSRILLIRGSAGFQH